MNTNYSVVTSNINKVSVTISRKDMWNNYVACWKELTWDDYSFFSELERVSKVLISGDKLNIDLLRKLFRDGNTVMLMNQAMRFLDTRDEIHREIVVEDDGEKYLIRHHDINF